MRTPAAAALLVAVVAVGCGATRAGLGVEEGKPAITWRSQRDPVPDEADPREATRVAEARLRQVEARGDDDLGTAEALYELAVARRRVGDTAEAARLYRQALEICERVQGPDGADVATALNAIGTLDAAEGRYGDAAPALERALEIRRKVLGAEDPLTAQSMNNLALLRAAEGNTAAAEPLYLAALAILEKAEGPPADGLDQVLDNYAALLRDTGRTTEAERLEARAGILRATRAVRATP